MLLNNGEQWRETLRAISILSIQLIMQISHSKHIKHPGFVGLRRVSWTYLQFAASGNVCETEPRKVRDLRTVRGSGEQQTPKWHQHFAKNGYPFFAKKLKMLYSSDHTILFKFHQHKVQIPIKCMERH